MTLRFEFAGFVLRPQDRTLAAGGKIAAVGPRAFDVLVALVERAGSLVTKDELFERVWPRLVVEENNLQVQVSALRKVVGHDAIATVPGHGYRFTLPVSTVSDGEPLREAPQALPHPPTAFIGRAAELGQTAELIGKTRLLTLVGVGGIGKTRLAIELAAAASAQFTDGVVFVELAAVEDASSIVDVVAAALAVTRDQRSSLREALRGHVAHRRQLIVLDNCEHMLRPCAELAALLVRAGPGTKVVATSREPLHVDGELVYRVPALAVPGERAGLDTMRDCAAVALFVDRGTAIERDFALTHDNASDIAHICRELDGIPLALELAASRLRVMPVKEIADHLCERFRLLVEGNRAALPRQQTLRATLDWSYQLLTEAERSLLRRLAVFAGGFEIDAAQAVGIGDDVRERDVLYLLAELVDKSLVVFDTRRTRYHLLETVRQYALERLAEAGEDTVVRDRHLHFHVALAERMVREIRGPRQHELIARITAERDNIASAFAQAGDSAGGGPAGLVMVHGFVPTLKMYVADLASRVAAVALAHPGAQAATVARCHALHVTAVVDLQAGRHDAALAKGTESVRIARKHDDAGALVESLNRLSGANIMLGRVAEAHAELLESLERASQLGDKPLIADAHCGLGELYSLDERKLELAQRHYQLALSCNTVEPDAAATLNFNLARNAVTLEAPGPAIGYLRDARRAVAGMSTYGYSQWTLCLCAGIAMLRREAALAMRLFGAGAAHCERTGQPYNEPELSQYGRWLARARECLDEATAAEAFATGEALSEEAACAEAIAWLESLP